MFTQKVKMVEINLTSQLTTISYDWQQRRFFLPRVSPELKGSYKIFMVQSSAIWTPGLRIVTTAEPRPR